MNAYMMHKKIDDISNKLGIQFLPSVFVASSFVASVASKGQACTLDGRQVPSQMQCSLIRNLVLAYMQCHVPNFSLGHNGLITFAIFIRVCQIDAKGQINAKEENY